MQLRGPRAAQMRPPSTRGVAPSSQDPPPWGRTQCLASAPLPGGCSARPRLPRTVVGGLRRAPHSPEGQPAPGTGRGRPPHGPMESWDPRHLDHGHGRARGSGAGGPQPFLQQARGEDSQACRCAGSTREPSPPHPPTRRRRPRAGQPVASVPSSGEGPLRPCGHVRQPRAHSRAPRRTIRPGALGTAEGCSEDPSVI